MKNYINTFEDFLNEAEKFKSTKDFEDFLEEIDGMDERSIKLKMGKDYIDTPGGYRDEADDYDNDITEYMMANMDKKEFEKLKAYWETNIKESVNEGTVMIFYYSKKSSEIDGDVKELQNKAQEYIKAMRDKDYIISSNDSVLYFPNFTWAGGKQEFGPSFGILAGSETMLVNPIGSDRILKINESLLVRLVKDGRIESYNLY